MTAGQRLINWTEAARLQLVEAVIKVEEEEMVINASTTGSRPAPAGPNASSTIAKWNAITRLLPVELQAKTWSPERLSYNIPKCYTTFHNLVKCYRDMIEGKGNSPHLTEHVCRLLKRREDLLNGRNCAPLERRLRPGSSKRVNANNLSSGRGVPKLSRKVGSSSQGQEGGQASEIQLIESTEEAQNFGSHAGIEQVTNNKGLETKGRFDGGFKGVEKIQWTETGCILVIEALIQVEEETRNKFKVPIQASTGRPMRKWERVEVLLPPALRGRTWNSQRQRYNKYKCERLLESVLQRYRDAIRRPGHMPPNHGLLTKLVCDLLGNLLRARSSVQAENSVKSGSSYSVGARACSANARENLSATGHSSLKSYTDQGCSTEWRSTARPTEKGVSSVSEHAKFPGESSEKAPRFDKNSEPDRTADEKPTETQGGDSTSLGCQSRPLILVHGLHNHNQSKPPSFTPASTFISGGESKDCEGMAMPTAPPAVQTPAPMRPQSRHREQLCNGSRTSSFARNSSTLITNTMEGENLHAMLDGRLRRLDLEFFHLSSWVQSQSVPIGTTLMGEIASSAIRSSKRRKLTDLTSTEPSDDKFDDRLSRYMDFRIGAAFEKVRIRIAEELTNTCAELTRELQQDTGMLSESPSSSPKVSDPDSQSQSEEKSAKADIFMHFRASSR